MEILLARVVEVTSAAGLLSLSTLLAILIWVIITCAFVNEGSRGFGLLMSVSYIGFVLWIFIGCHIQGCRNTYYISNEHQTEFRRIEPYSTEDIRHIPLDPDRDSTIVPAKDVIVDGYFAKIKVFDSDGNLRGLKELSSYPPHFLKQGVSTLEPVRASYSAAEDPNQVYNGYDRFVLINDSGDIEWRTTEVRGTDSSFGDIGRSRGNPHRYALTTDKEKKQYIVWMSYNEHRSRPEYHKDYNNKRFPKGMGELWYEYKRLVFITDKHAIWKLSDVSADKVSYVMESGRMDYSEANYSSDIQVRGIRRILFDREAKMKLGELETRYYNNAEFRRLEYSDYYCVIDPSFNIKSRHRVNDSYYFETMSDGTLLASVPLTRSDSFLDHESTGDNMYFSINVPKEFGGGGVPTWLFHPSPFYWTSLILGIPYIAIMMVVACRD